jgi:hypothetical protein
LEYVHGARVLATSLTSSGQPALRCNRSASARPVGAQGHGGCDDLAAISTATGTAADPGTTKARVDADLTVFANNVATIAARINACISRRQPPGQWPRYVGFSNL